MQSWIRPNSNPNLINTEQEHNHFIKIIKSISDWYYIKYFLYLSSSALKFSILLVVKWSPIAFFTWHGLQHLITDLLSHLKNWIPWKNHIISYRYFLITIFHVHVTTSYGLFYGICGCGSPAQNVLPLINCCLGSGYSARYDHVYYSNSVYEYCLYLFWKKSYRNNRQCKKDIQHLWRTLPQNRWR